MMIEEKQWYVLQAAHNSALKARQLFENLGVETFVPMEMREVITKGKKVSKKLMPIFFNLIFVDIGYSQLRQIKAANNYLWYLQNNNEGKKEPMVVPRDEMRRFIDFIDGNFQEIEYIDTGSFNIKKGEKVRITDGVFKGKEGLFVKISGKRSKQIVVSIEGLLAVTLIHRNPSQIIEKI